MHNSDCPQMIFRCSRDQAQRLRQVFKTKPYPSKYEKQALASELDLPLSFVTNWFQRERNQYKKDNKELPLQETNLDGIRRQMSTATPAPRREVPPTPPNTRVTTPVAVPTPLPAYPVIPPNYFHPQFRQALAIQAPPMKPQRGIVKTERVWKPQLALPQVTVQSRPQLRRQTGASTLPAINEHSASELPAPSPTAFPPRSPTSPGTLMIDESFISSPEPSSSCKSATSGPKKPFPASEKKKIVASFVQNCNEENPLKTEKTDEIIDVEKLPDSPADCDTMLPPLKEKDIKEEDREGATFNEDDIRKGFQDSQMQEIRMLQQMVTRYQTTMVNMTAAHNQMVRDFQAAMAYDHYMRTNKVAIHPSLFFGKQFK